MGNTFSWFKRKVEETKAHYLGFDDDMQESINIDSDVIIREILHLNKSLMFDGGLSVQEKEDTVTKIGHMAYMGPPEAARTAGTCLNEIITLLKSKATSKHFKEKLVMALCEICYLNRENQNKTIPVLPTLVRMMGDREDIHMSRLACYCLTCLVCNNYNTLTALYRTPALRKSLAVCVSGDRPWIGWPDNYSKLLTDLLAVSNQLNLSPSQAESMSNL